MERNIYKYTPWYDRSLIYEGTFLEGEDVDINIGDEILVFHQCRDCKEHILMKVEKKIVAYYFNNIPVYDYCVIDGGSYKCCTKHISLFDQIVGECVCNIKH